jgi:hypothetical protein
MSTPLSETTDQSPTGAVFGETNVDGDGDGSSSDNEDEKAKLQKKKDDGIVYRAKARLVAAATAAERAASVTESEITSSPDELVAEALRRLAMIPTGRSMFSGGTPSSRDLAGAIAMNIGPLDDAFAEISLATYEQLNADLHAIVGKTYSDYVKSKLPAFVYDMLGDNVADRFREMKATDKLFPLIILLHFPVNVELHLNRDGVRIAHTLAIVDGYLRQICKELHELTGVEFVIMIVDLVPMVSSPMAFDSGLSAERESVISQCMERITKTASAAKMCYSLMSGNCIAAALRAFDSHCVKHHFTSSSTRATSGDGECELLFSIKDHCTEPFVLDAAGNGCILPSIQCAVNAILLLFSHPSKVLTGLQREAHGAAFRHFFRALAVPILDALVTKDLGLKIKVDAFLSPATDDVYQLFDAPMDEVTWLVVDAHLPVVLRNIPSTDAFRLLPASLRQLRMILSNAGQLTVQDITHDFLYTTEMTKESIGLSNDESARVEATLNRPIGVVPSSITPVYLTVEQVLGFEGMRAALEATQRVVDGGSKWAASAGLARIWRRCRQSFMSMDVVKVAFERALENAIKTRAADDAEDAIALGIMQRRSASAREKRLAASMKPTHVEMCARFSNIRLAGLAFQQTLASRAQMDVEYAQQPGANDGDGDDSGVI